MCFLASLSHTHQRTCTRTHIDFHEVNITYLLFHCSGCLSGTWMKRSSFSIRSSREPSPHDLARYGEAAPPPPPLPPSVVHWESYSHTLPAVNYTTGRHSLTPKARNNKPAESCSGRVSVLLQSEVGRAGLESTTFPSHPSAFSHAGCFAFPPSCFFS